MPILDLSLYGTPLHYWASVQIQAAMLFPHDVTQRKQYLAVSAADWLEQHPEEPAKIAIGVHCFLPAGGLATLIHSDAVGIIKERAVKAGTEGTIAGDMLLLIWQMIQDKIDKPSVNKAKYLLQHEYRTKAVLTGEGYLPPAANNEVFSRVWSAYRPVAHLWAAGHLTQHDPHIPPGTPELGELYDPALLPYFLARAELLRCFGEQCRPHAQRSPLLPPDKTWTVPRFVPLPNVTLPIIPLKPSEREALAAYKASI